MNPKISIVIPVYNAGMTIQNCLESIQSQNLTDLEIICINDNSNDDTIDLIEEFSRTDSRIVTIHNSQNLGPGPCRNIGLKLAKAETIRFIDADDALTVNCLQFQYEYLKTHKLQAVKGAYNRTSRSGDSIRVKLIDKGFIVNSSNASDQQIELLLYDHWCYLFDLNFLRNENLTYPSLTNAQDSVFIQNCVQKMKRFAYIPKLVYQYNFSQSSIIRKKDNPDWFKNIFFEKINLFRTLTEMGRDELAVKMLFDAFINYFDKSIFPSLLKLEAEQINPVLSYLADQVHKVNMYYIMRSVSEGTRSNNEDEILNLVAEVSDSSSSSDYSFFFNRYS